MSPRMSFTLPFMMSPLPAQVMCTDYRRCWDGAPTQNTYSLADYILIVDTLGRGGSRGRREAAVMKKEVQMGWDKRRGTSSLRGSRPGQARLHGKINSDTMGSLTGCHSVYSIIVGYNLIPLFNKWPITIRETPASL